MRERLQQAFVNTFNEVSGRNFSIQISGQDAAARHIFESFNREIRIHRAGAKSEQKGDMQIHSISTIQKVI